MAYKVEDEEGRVNLVYVIDTDIIQDSVLVYDPAIGIIERNEIGML